MTVIVTPVVSVVVVKPVPEPVAVTVIVAVPGATAVTTAPDTDAIEALLVAYVYAGVIAAEPRVTFGTIVID